MAAEDTRRPVAIAGAGAVAQTLARALRQNGVPVAAVARRGDIASLPRLASTIIIAVSDDAIASVASTLAAGMRSGIALHTCGARGPDVLAPLRDNGVACGVLHPMQSLPAAADPAVLHGITFGVAGDPPALEAATQLARLVGGIPLQVDAEHFAQYHAAAVMASNHVVAVLDAAVALLGEAGVQPRDALAALGRLCRTTVDNVLAHGTVDALTGPVARGDAGTVRAHLEALSDSPDAVRSLYRAASQRLVDVARRRGLAAARIDALSAALE